MSEVVVIIPAFNEELTIGRVVGRARPHAPVVVVDDGSTDRTAEEAEQAGATVISCGSRRGKGVALRAGVEAARQSNTAWVVTLDGDGQHSPEDIPRLHRVARQAGAAIVVGGRLGHPHGIPRSRLNACRVAGFFINWITGTLIHDTQSGFRCYSVDVFDGARPRQGGFVLETELLISAARAGWRVVEVEIGEGSPALRPSRFRLADGVAIGAYLAARVLEHCALEACVAVRDLASVFDRECLRARHAEMMVAALRYPDAQRSGFAVAWVAVRRARARLRGWWHHPRRRRAGLAATAIAASPALLALALAEPLCNRLGVDLISSFVGRFYCQDRLGAAAEHEHWRMDDVERSPSEESLANVEP
jgi:hypothetical protein